MSSTIISSTLSGGTRAQRRNRQKRARSAEASTKLPPAAPTSSSAPPKTAIHPPASAASATDAELAQRDSDSQVASGGTRAQRRNRQKRERAASEASSSRPEADTSSTLATVATAAAEEPARKKTKKEKQRERKAADNTDAEHARHEAIEGGRRLFVGRLPQSTTEQDIRAAFGACGQIAELEMLRRHDAARRFKGSAFLTFACAADAAKALALDGTQWSTSSKHIAVQRAQASASAPPSSAEPAGGGAVEAAPCTSCFVGNLPVEPKQRDVRDAFRGLCGQKSIRKVRVLPTVDGAGRVFIDFNTPAAAAAAVAQSGCVLLGRPLVVAFSRRAGQTPSGAGRRSTDAKARRRLKRAQERDQPSQQGEQLLEGSSASGGKLPVLRLGSS